MQFTNYHKHFHVLSHYLKDLKLDRKSSHIIEIFQNFMAHFYTLIFFQKMISNVLALACLPFWKDNGCVIPDHDIIIRQVIADVEHQLRHPTEHGIEHLAWSIDAAKFRDYSGPAQCNCDSKYELAELLTRLYHEAPVNLCVSAMWACPSDWDAPMPKY